MDSDEPLYQRDPQAWQAHLAEGNRTQPRKRVSAEVLLRDTSGRVLLVNPTYKPDWDIPGGMAEANEPPATAARRELREELGIEHQVQRLLCLDWVQPHGPWDDLLVFVFDGGTLTTGRTESLRLADGELSETAFCAREAAAQRLRPYVWRRVHTALNALHDGGTRYTHNGYPFPEQR